MVKRWLVASAVALLVVMLGAALVGFGAALVAFADPVGWAAWRVGLVVGGVAFLALLVPAAMAVHELMDG